MLTNSQTFQAIAETVVPEVRDLDREQWAAMQSIIERGLAARPAKMQRQLALFMRALNVLSLLKYGRMLHQLIPSMRTEFLEEVQSSRILLVRRGFWGLRTLVFMGFYARPAASAHVGYRGHVDGWSAR